jgi:hypothetical protein
MFLFKLTDLKRVRRSGCRELRTQTVVQVPPKALLLLLACPKDVTLQLLHVFQRLDSRPVELPSGLYHVYRNNKDDKVKQPADHRHRESPVSLIRIARDLPQPRANCAKKGKRESEAPIRLLSAHDDGQRIENEEAPFPVGCVVNPPYQPDEDQRLEQGKPFRLTSKRFGEEHHRKK